MLQLYLVYSLWNKCKTLTGSLDPTHANRTNKPCTSHGLTCQEVSRPLQACEGDRTDVWLAGGCKLQPEGTCKVHDIASGSGPEQMGQDPHQG